MNASEITLSLTVYNNVEKKRKISQFLLIITISVNYQEEMKTLFEMVIKKKKNSDYMRTSFF